MKSSRRWCFDTLEREWVVSLIDFAYGFTSESELVDFLGGRRVVECHVAGPWWRWARLVVQKESRVHSESLMSAHSSTRFAHMVASGKAMIALTASDGGLASCFALVNAPPTLVPFIKGPGSESFSDFVYFVTKAGYGNEWKALLAASTEVAEGRTAVRRGLPVSLPFRARTSSR